jgi:hypothetical protein
MSEQPDDAGIEEVDAVPVLAEARPLQQRVGSAPLAVQAAAVAVSGFAAGAATVAVVRHRKVRKAARRRRRKSERLLGNVVASRSFLVDVHLLAPRDR